jgi:hypothetical protein
MKHAVLHDLGPERAKKVAEAALASYQQKFAKYHPQARWTSETRASISFSAKGISLNGTLEVRPNSIEMELDVPFLLRPFQSKAIGVIEGEIREWIAKAKAGEI